MKFKSKRHALLAIKKKSGIELTAEEAKELMGLEPKEEPKKEEEKKQEPKKEEMKEEPKKEEDKGSYDKDKKDSPAAGETKEDQAAPAAMSIEDLTKMVKELQENVGMMMEAMTVLMNGDSGEEKPAEESKEGEESQETKETYESEDDEDEMTEEEMEKELEKTISEIESLQNS